MRQIKGYVRSIRQRRAKIQLSTGGIVEAPIIPNIKIGDVVSVAYDYIRNTVTNYHLWIEEEDEPVQFEDDYEEVFTE